MKFSRVTRRAGAVITLTVSGVLVTAGLAFADSTVYEGDDYATYSNGKLTVCDKESDGNGVYAEYRGPSASHGFVWDGNGSSNGCGSASVAVTKFRVCEDDFGSDSCSSWVYG